MNAESIGKTVVAKFGTGTINQIGRVVGYQKSPTLIIELPNGERLHWCADLCEELMGNCESTVLWLEIEKLRKNKK